jgi:hypothetical protein
MAPRHGACVGAIPASRANHTPRASRAAESPKLSPRGAAPRRRANFRGRGRQAMRLPCKQAHVGALPTDSTNFQLRETRPKYREKPHKLLQVGVTPTPATNFMGSVPAAGL